MSYSEPILKNTDQCTSCGACSTICPRKCIQKVIRKDSSWYYVKNIDECIHCGLCEKVCPTLSNIQKNHPTKLYAAWAKNPDDRKNGASGGIATSIYRFASANNWYATGVAMTNNFVAMMEVRIPDNYTITKWQNSKYTFSWSADTFAEIARLLNNSLHVLFIGMPCQVAAIKNYLNIRKVSTNNFYCIDSICHGMPGPQPLKDHIEYINNKKQKKAEKCVFRDSSFGTDKYYFTLYESNNPQPFYKKPVTGADLYQAGFHKAIIYRDCCYSCIYTTHERCGDLTLGDSHGLGRIYPFPYDKTNTSFIFVNTKKGEEIISLLQESVELINTSLEEPFTYEKQLNHPSVMPSQRELYMKYYTNGYKYSKAAQKSFVKLIYKDILRDFIHLKHLKAFIRRLVKNRRKKT